MEESPALPVDRRSPDATAPPCTKNSRRDDFKRSPAARDNSYASPALDVPDGVACIRDIQALANRMFNIDRWQSRQRSAARFRAACNWYPGGSANLDTQTSLYCN